jgi:hypothetical protein
LVGSVHRIDDIIDNPHLSRSISDSISRALEDRTYVHLNGNTVWSVFKKSLDSAIYDLERHEKAPLFKRLIRYGPLNPDDPPEMTMKGGITTLTDDECGSCVQFIFSFMVNRFKGELAELLALSPVIDLIHSLQKTKCLPRNLHLFWGETVHVRSKPRRGNSRLGFYVKGADGLLVQKDDDSIIVHGVVEVKSYRIGKAAMDQITRHCSGLRRGLRLESTEYSPEAIAIRESGLIRILVGTSLWKLNRDLLPFNKNRPTASIAYKDPYGEEREIQPREIEDRTWKITLGWSKEAIEQAAYDMTFWYMAQVGARVFAENNRPSGWEDMTKEQAGMNAIKMMLYYLPLRPLTENQEKLAVQLYNIYSFGYPLGIYHGRKRQMLWWENGTLKPLKMKRKKI